MLCGADVVMQQALDKEAAAAAAQEFGQRLQAEGGLASPNKEKGRSRGLRRIQQVHTGSRHTIGWPRSECGLMRHFSIY